MLVTKTTMHGLKGLNLHQDFQNYPIHLNSDLINIFSRSSSTISLEIYQFMFCSSSYFSSYFAIFSPLENTLGFDKLITT